MKVFVPLFLPHLIMIINRDRTPKTLLENTGKLKKKHEYLCPPIT